MGNPEKGGGIVDCGDSDCEGQRIRQVHPAETVPPLSCALAVTVMAPLKLVAVRYASAPVPALMEIKASVLVGETGDHVIGDALVCFLCSPPPAVGRRRDKARVGLRSPRLRATVRALVEMVKLGLSLTGRTTMVILLVARLLAPAPLS